MNKFEQKGATSAPPWTKRQTDTSTPSGKLLSTQAMVQAIR